MGWVRFVVVVYIRFLGCPCGRWGTITECYTESVACGMIRMLEDLFPTDLKESCEAHV